MLRDALGDRMKKYEYVTRTYLTPRTPAIIRIDGKAFHTFTKGFVKPFDEVFSKSMQDTMKFLCKNIQGCVLGYTQSDEITLVLIDYKELDSQGWFDYNIQKMCSVSASMATLAFNDVFKCYAVAYARSKTELSGDEITTDKKKLIDIYNQAMLQGAMFDARVFNIPREEVTNCVLWRQNDATRNSIQMVGYSNFSQKEMQNKSCNEVQDMLMLQKGINWNDFPAKYKRGSCCIRVPVDGTEYSKWEIDNEIPIFKGEGRDYIERLVYPTSTKE